MALQEDTGKILYLLLRNTRIQKHTENATFLPISASGKIGDRALCNQIYYTEYSNLQTEPVASEFNRNTSARYDLKSSHLILPGIYFYCKSWTIYLTASNRCEACNNQIRLLQEPKHIINSKCSKCFCRSIEMTRQNLLYIYLIFLRNWELWNYLFWFLFVFVRFFVFFRFFFLRNVNFTTKWTILERYISS